MYNKKYNIFIFISIWLFLMWLVIDIDDLECIKRNDVCTVYTRKAFFKSHIKDSFKISDIEEYFTKKAGTGGKHIRYYYYPVLITKNKEIYLDSFSSSYRYKSEEILERIMDDQDFEIKGTYFKTIFRSYP